MKRISILSLFLVTLTFNFSLIQNAMGDSFTGRVLDWHTKEPIEGAVVVYEWEKSFCYIKCSYWCANVESAITNKKGRYYISILHTGDKKNYAFKAGYRRYFDKTRRSHGYKEGITYLEKDNRTVDERLEYLRRLTLSCRQDNDARKVLAPLYYGIYNEAKFIAKSKEDKGTANGIMGAFEANDISYEEAKRREKIRQAPLFKKIFRAVAPVWADPAKGAKSPPEGAIGISILPAHKE